MYMREEGKEEENRKAEAEVEKKKKNGHDEARETDEEGEEGS